MGFWQDITGQTAADAARSAAADQYAKEQAAIQGQRQAGQTAQGDYFNLAQQFQPYQNYGKSALEMMMAGLGLGGAGSQDAFNAAWRNTPGYQSQFEEGLRASLRGTAASGHGLGSGGALRALTRYGQGQADQGISNYYNRLAGLGQLGFGATQAGVNTAGTGIGANLGAQTSAYGGAMNSAKTIGQGDVAAAQAQQGALTNLVALGTGLAGSYLGGGMKMPSPQMPGTGPYPFKFG